MKKYKKSDLRLKLQAQMGQPVSKLEFAKWLRWYCELEHRPEELIQAKTLSAEEVAALEKWLGYPMR